ncbi:YdeI/OmpD-associated family protein [Patulibacter defluvii]|uniref:YdeI/OmpD-associated family protein n=1 Tax=Patulibacter defluvii TaxID=3095358 RepID=UPI002A762F59|nr:YdeI/OmpD-associated family protein [Patulibacter sp. DM4]
MAAADDLPLIPFATPAEWDAWLDEHAETADGVWIKIAKKGTGVPSVVWAEAVEVALAHGWIDGQARSIDERWYQQRFTPRRARSRWSKINRATAERLIAAGTMRPAGLRAVEAAKADGRWEAAYDSPATATVPDDLQAALDARPGAAEFFAALDGRNRYAILHRIAEAKRADTRARRIEQFAAMCAAGETIHPPAKRRAG